MAAVLYGPRGEKIGVVAAPSNGLTGGTEEVLRKLDRDALELQVQKRVRSQATTLSQVWDPNRGKPKPTSITFRTLRMMAQRNEWCQAIIKTRKSQIGNVDWSIVPQDDSDKSPGVLNLCSKIENLLRRPSMHGSRVYQRSWRQFIGEYLEDILVIDAGCIEKERTTDKWIAGLYPVDGATVAPNMDEHGGYHDDAYVQVVDGQVAARFGMEDLIYTMANPQTDVRFAGYGYSPLEALVVSVTAELYASKFNASYFEKGAVPEGMINLGPEAAPEDVNAFRLYWANELMGRPWAIPILGGSKAEWIPWRVSQKDAQFMEYQQWLLKKICAVYQIAPQEVGELEDVNRTTATEQSQTNRSKSLEPILHLIEDEFEVSIIGELGLGVQDYVRFQFDPDLDPEGELQKWSILIDKGAGTRNEMRAAMGEEPGEDPGLDLYLSPTVLSPLPASTEEAQEARLEAQGAGRTEPGETENSPDTEPEEVNSGEVPWSDAPQPIVGKTHPTDDVEDDMQNVWTRAERNLRSELEDILNMPLVEA